mmetsp:Transcript_32833/g.56135  ORF Transcript_32833/g.56135 Transcript_32833/m.56135 type:complete len:247 (+) Transcript_32833:485-1225(+)
MRCVSISLVASQYTESSMIDSPNRLRFSSPYDETAVPIEMQRTVSATVGRGRGCPKRVCTIIVTTGVKPFSISMNATVRYMYDALPVESAAVDAKPRTRMFRRQKDQLRVCSGTTPTTRTRMKLKSADVAWWNAVSVTGYGKPALDSSTLLIIISSGPTSMYATQVMTVSRPPAVSVWHTPLDSTVAASSSSLGGVAPKCAAATFDPPGCERPPMNALFSSFSSSVIASSWPRSGFMSAGVVDGCS